MRPTLVLHVLPEVATLGAARSVISSAHASNTSGAFRHSIASLSPVTDSVYRFLSQMGIPLIYGDEALQKAFVAADIVHAHYWNSPSFFDFWSGDHQPVRLAITSHISGRAAPQRVPDDVLALPNRFIATSTSSARELGQRRGHGVDLIHAAADFSRLSFIPPIRSEKGRIGAMITLDEAKVHRMIYDLLSQGAEGDRVLLAGHGDLLPSLRARSKDYGSDCVVEFLGHIGNIADFFSQIDLFAHPLALDSYGTSEATVHEAMFAGRPPILLVGRGPEDLIENGVTGILASNEGEFVEALRRYVSDGVARAAMGHAASKFAQRNLGPTAIASSLDAIYKEMLDEKPSKITPLERRTGAEALLHVFGPEAAALESLLQEISSGKISNDALPIRWVSQAGGGIIHYRRYWPDDSRLREWSAIGFERLARPALAAMERHSKN
jgi:glycosyltransferase involved in cell wall biosynthesis